MKGDTETRDCLQCLIDSESGTDHKCIPIDSVNTILRHEPEYTCGGEPMFSRRRGASIELTPHPFEAYPVNHLMGESLHVCVTMSGVVYR